MADISELLAKLKSAVKSSPHQVTHIPRLSDSREQQIILTAEKFGRIVTRIGLAADSGYLIVALPQPKLASRETIPASGQPGPVFRALRRLIAAIPPSQVEVDTAGQEAEVKTDWNNWQQLAGDIYEQSIHPAVLNVIAIGQNELPAGSIVDLFGGDGRMISKLTKLPRLKQRNFFILDNHLPSLRTAQQKFNAFKNVRIRKPLDLTASSEIFRGLGSPALVTVVGGICAGVVTRTQALNIMKQVYAALEASGLAIVTGFTPVLLNAQDFHQLGFTVVQSSIPENILAMKKPDQMYVLMK